jgi:cytochrome oxidase Cu insertion factor (SCO1/SenC/PrrC family)/thiol-disulfide isomerase/thioredoxin
MAAGLSLRPSHLRSPRVLWASAALIAILVAGLLIALPRLRPPTGTLLVLGSAHAADSLAPTTIGLHATGGGWSAVGSVSGPVPAAPEQRELLALQVAVGSYDGVRVGGAEQLVNISVVAGQVEPLLIGIQSGHLMFGAAYAGNDQVNLGLGELSGKFVAMPTFDLTDQAGNPFNNATIAGQDVVIAAFHTTCHQTCPLYTALFAQLEKQKLPEDVLLVEVTTDPATDTRATLADYARSIGAKWRFGTGSPDALTAFWQPFGVALATGDSHVSTLALLDRHGYIRLVYRGVPQVGHDISPVLVTSLGAEGLRELASGGDGWGTPQVLQSLFTISGPEQVAPAGGGAAPAFSLAGTDGAHASLAGLLGRPLVINFWAAYCAPCRLEMPLLQSKVGAQTAARLVLINEGDDSQAARSFLRSVGVSQASLLDSDLSVGRAYGAVGLPMTVFVRADGSIAARQIGQIDERVLVAELSTLGGQ